MEISQRRRVLAVMVFGFFLCLLPFVVFSSVVFSFFSLRNVRNKLILRLTGHRTHTAPLDKGNAFFFPSLLRVPGAALVSLSFLFL